MPPMPARRTRRDSDWDHRGRLLQCQPGESGSPAGTLREPADFNPPAPWPAARGGPWSRVWDERGMGLVPAGR
jgi:hypothetical protein